MIRYNADGTRDPDFGIEGVVLGPTGSFFFDLVLQPNGEDVSILAFGRVFVDSEYDFALGRYFSDGILDLSFGWTP